MEFHWVYQFSEVVTGQSGRLPDVAAAAVHHFRARIRAYGNSLPGRGSLVPKALLILTILLASPGPQQTALGVDDQHPDTLNYHQWKNLAEGYSDSNPDSSLYYIGLAEAEEDLTLEQKAHLTRLRADAYYYKYDFATAAEHYRAAAAIEKEVHGEMSLHYAERLGDVGFCYHRMADYPRAVSHYKSALKIVRAIGNRPEIATNLNNIGMIFNNWGRYDSAIRYHSEALEIDKGLGDPYFISVDYNNIGKIYESWGKYELALDYYEESLEYARKSGRENSIAIRLNNIGMVYKTLGDHASALKYLLEALEIDTRMDNRYRIAVRYHNLGQVYDATGDATKAMEFYKLSLARFRALDHPEGQAYVLSSMGEQFARLGKYKAAETYYLGSLRIADSMGLAQSVVANYGLLAQVYERAGDYRKALGAFKALAARKDSLFTENEQQLMTEFQTKYETGKKEQEIALLNKEKEIDRLKLRKANIQLYSMVGTVLLLAAIVLLLVARYRFKHRVNRLLQQQNAQLETLNATKDKFFAIISHDLRNPMAGIRNVAQAAAENFGELSGEELKRLIDSMHSGTQQVHELMQNLLLWARAQGRSARYEPAEISVGELIGRSVDLNSVRAGEKNIRIEYIPNGSDKAYADENMVRTILRNLITNSVKFTPPGGRVTISTDNTGGNLTVAVADTGIGMTEEDQAKLFRIDRDVKSIGNSEEKGSGLGLIICREFVEQNGGTISVESEKGKGSIFSFTLPVVKPDQ